MDGIGALASLLFTGIVLPFFADPLGLPVETLYFLASFPLFLSIYSLSCFFWVEHSQKWMLAITIGGNCLYCVVSGGLIAFSNNIAKSGMFILSSEIIVVLLVVAVEIHIYRNGFESQ